MTTEHYGVEAEDLADVDDSATALIINLMQQNANNAAHLSNNLMEGYKLDYEKALATIAQIRFNVENLFASGYMPTESAIIRALYSDLDY
jgi:hypothetical protein